ncbi:hypothetical protein [Flaviflexus salsibiostraticola]|nr:hypothetical protein [Flaviflexus salsibiostraticola]
MAGAEPSEDFGTIHRLRVVRLLRGTMGIRNLRVPAIVVPAERMIDPAV